MGVMYLFLSLAVVGLGMNGVLIFLAVRAKHESREMVVVVGLAVVDMVLPMFTIASVIYNLITRRPIDSVPLMCTIEGVVDFVSVFMSMFLVAAIALVRLSHVIKWDIPFGLRYALASFALVFVGLCVACGLRNEFYILESNIYCAPVAATSPISMAVLVLHSLSLLVFLGIALACYAKIISALLSSYRDFNAINLHNDIAIAPTQHWETKRPGIIRTTVIILSYLITILPPSILMFLEAVLPMPISKSLNTPIDLFIVSISILNPSLVLFAHSAIFKELTLLFTHTP
ncbi:hypothetical protein DSO57_1006178 [Entomophthora muscae]|uniref:Uncharacterized protein n=1 Tax=Entomophthora muscae TaxID=34485 RepID=A0ACC2RME2_9FUNG|nr:hypothetical protein DSO57_1006178 [Entomophthora muscae]